VNFLSGTSELQSHGPLILVIAFLFINFPDINSYNLIARVERKERIYHVDDTPSGAADKIIPDSNSTRNVSQYAPRKILDIN
jgi:hypothetical protein